MKRSKRNIVRQVALGLAIAAIIPATAQAQSPDDRAVSKASIGQQTMSPDDRAVSKASIEQPLVSPDDRAFSKVSTQPQLGNSAVNSPDDRTFSKATSVGTAPVPTGNGDRIDFSSYTISASIIALLLAMGAVIVVRHSRKGRLSPA